MITARKTNFGAPLHDFQYLEYLPADYGTGKRFPLVIFLHGAGERGDNVELTAVHGYLKHARKGTEYPFVVIAPQCPNDTYWGAYIESLNALLDYALAHYDVDPDRVILTGLSMGGTGTWLWSLANPQRFAAIVPVCGTGVTWFGGQLANTPVWACHGEADDCVDVTESIRMVQSIRRSGGKPRLSLYPGVGHNAWDNAYSDPEILEWILAQHR